MSHTPPELPNAPKDAERLKAFELFLSSNLEGKARSLRSIAGSLGLNPSTVRRWADIDQWQEKVNKALTEATSAAETTQNAIKRRVRQGLLNGLGELQRLSLKADKDSDRIAAVKALVEIAIKIEAVTAAAGPGKGEDLESLEFNDALPEEGDDGGGERLDSGSLGRGGVLPPEGDGPDSDPGDDGQGRSREVGDLGWSDSEDSVEGVEEPEA